MMTGTSGARRWTRLATASVVATALVVFGWPGVASAHHPEIVAEVDCNFVVTYTATAWESPVPDSRHNNQIIITVNGVQAGTGQFTAANNYSFSGSFQATPATSYTIRATAAVQWGVNEDRGLGGEWRETTIQAPDPCPPSTTVPPTTAPPTTAPPSSSTPPPTTEAPTTTVATTSIPTEVEGEIEVAPPAQPVPGQPSFTG